MATKQRENARREKQQKKDAKTKKIIWIFLIAIIILLIIMKVCEIDFSALKNRFTDSDGNFTLSATADEQAYPFQLDSSNATVNSINDKLNILTSSSISVLNPTNAEVVYSFNHGFANPILKYAGNYYCVYDQGSNKFRLDTNNENIYETTTEDSVLCADVAKNGTVIYATNSSNSKSVITVVNTSLKEKMNFEFNDGYVVSVAINSSATKCAFVAINSKDAKLATTVYTMSVGDTETKYSFDFGASNVVDLHYSDSDDLYFVGTDCVGVIQNQKKNVEVFEQGSVNTLSYCYTSSNELVYAYSLYSGSNESKVSYITSSGKIKTTVDFTQSVKFVSSQSNEFTVLLTDKIVTYSLNKGKEKSTISCDDSVSYAFHLSSKMLVKRQQLIDILS